MFKRNPKNINSLTVRTKKVSLHKPKLKSNPGVLMNTVDIHDVLPHNEHKITYKETFIDKIVDKYGVIPLLIGLILSLLLLIALSSSVAKSTNVEIQNQQQTQSKTFKITKPESGA